MIKKVAIIGCFGITALVAGIWWLLAKDAEENAQIQNHIVQAFSDQSCTNPCWESIEVGVSQEEDVVTFLESHDIAFSIENLSGNGKVYNFIPEAKADWAVSLGIQSASIILYDGTVSFIGFQLELCVSDVIQAYGVPEVSGDTSMTLLYPEKGIWFLMDGPTGHISMATLITRQAINSAFPKDERLSWSEIEVNVSKTCKD